MRGFVLWTLWNLFLAVVPVALGYAAARLGKLAGVRRNGWVWGGFVLLLVLWLAFVPNTCYLLTEWRHFLDRVDSRNLYLQAEQDRRMLVTIGVLALFYGLYSGFGALTLTLSIRPLEQLLRRWRLPFPVIAPVLFSLLSLGVYLGLIVRLNSWDLWTRPQAVWTSVAAAFQYPLLLAVIAAFALVLWALYEALDVWVDGVVARTGRSR